MRRIVAALVVVCVCACGSPTPPTAAHGAEPAASTTAASTAPAPSTATPTASASAITPPSDAARDARIHRRFGGRCHLERTCGALWGVDCDAAIDGPYYYVKPDTLEIVSRCGGYCMGGRCTHCPPPEWTCPTY